jgi:hypothetical protein
MENPERFGNLSFPAQIENHGNSRSKNLSRATRFRRGCPGKANEHLLKDDRTLFLFFIWQRQMSCKIFCNYSSLHPFITLSAT